MLDSPYNQHDNNLNKKLFESVKTFFYQKIEFFLMKDQLKKGQIISQQSIDKKIETLKINTFEKLPLICFKTSFLTLKRYF